MTEPSQYFKGRTVQEQMNEVIGYVDVRSAEVATTAIAADVAQVHQDMLDANADAQAAAASAAAAAGTLANAVKKTGESSQSIAGNIVVAGNLTGGTVTVPTPVNNTDAANKKYVDDADALKLNITDVGNYAVLLTGNQGPITGIKNFTSEIKVTKSGSQALIVLENPSMVREGSYVFAQSRILFAGNNGIEMCGIEFLMDGEGKRYLRSRIYTKDGSVRYKTIFAIDENGNELS